jgi:hypothetical protein
VLFADRFWFARDYLTNSHQKAERGTARWVADSLDASASVQPVPIPADCTDGFYAAYWARPEAYLDPAVRSGISALALEKDEVVSEALLRLSEDLTTGAWDQRYGTLRSAAYLDVGYRLIHT